MRLSPKDKFEYLFDFGDQWWHEIEVVSVEEADPAVKYPLIVKRSGESPPQYQDYDEGDE